MKEKQFKKISAIAFLLVIGLYANAQVLKEVPSVHYVSIDKKPGEVFHLKAEKGKESLLLFKEGRLKMFNFAIEFDAVAQNSDSKFGLISRYVNDKEWTYVGCDLTSDVLTNSHWYVSTPIQKKEIAVEISKFYKSYKRHIRIEQMDKSVSVYMDGEKIADCDASLMGSHSGFIGFRSHNGGDVEISNVKITAIKALVPKAAKSSSIKLASNKMEVTFSKEFPTVYQYRIKDGNTIVWGAKKIVKGFRINGQVYAAKTKVFAEPNKIVYQSEISDINVDLTTEFTLDNTVLKMNITKIEEHGDVKVKTIGFPNHAIVSINNSDTGAMLSVADDIHSDNFIPLNNRPADTTASSAAIAILNNDKIAITIDNNSIYNAKQVLYQTISVGKERFSSIFSNEWIYRGINNEMLPLPEMKVIFTADANDDQKVDWQDAAYALSKVYPEPYGADLIRNAYATITMNFASGGQYPFLRQLDNIKKFYLATDGFAQMLELKGYQSEGHDSAHPDYAGHYNQRAGGLADLQYLTKQAKLYNALIGVHINHSEAYPEAKAYNHEIITDIPGWSWLDQAFLINKEADIKNGGFTNRLNQMKLDLPDLAFVYLDTYREHRSIAQFTAKSFNQHGWPIWTEDPEIFYREAVWTHSAPDSRTLISRFVQHKFRDGYAEHPVLLGGYSRGAEIGFMGWQKGRDFNLVLRNFFTQQLPYRYLMHFGLKKVEENKAIFEGGLISETVHGINRLIQNGILIKDGENIFIPWNPDTKEKIYHYNKNGGESTWTLPENWKATGTVSLYKLTAQGRQWVADLPINPKREIVIHAIANQGYVVYKDRITNIEEINWGEGGPISNPGFDGGLHDWKVSGNPVKVIQTPYGQDVLQMDGKAEVSQDVVLQKGMQYMVSVWCKIEGKGKATLSVGNQSYSIMESNVTNFTDNTDRYKTNFQRIKVPYTAPGENTTVKLSFENPASGSFVQFDDVRIVKQSIRKETTHAYFEDFEDIDEGWGPFISSKPSSYTTHLSERHAGYTDDTIEGNFSLKTWREGNGEVYRTSQAMIRFKPNALYKVQFDYKSTVKGVYRVIVRSAKDNKRLIDSPLDGTSHFSGVFTTTNQDDYYISIIKEGDGVFIIDNFAVDGHLDK